MRRIDYMAYCMAHRVCVAQALRIRDPWLSLIDLYYITPLRDSYEIHKGSPYHYLRLVAFDICTQCLHASYVIIVVPREASLDTPWQVQELYDCCREESQNSRLCAFRCALSALSSLCHLASCTQGCFLVQHFLLAQLLYTWCVQRWRHACGRTCTVDHRRRHSCDYLAGR